MVSVIVVTYNSSKFILETLNSIKQQTWSSIQLIITDDCSSDSTVQLCQDWLAANRLRFKTSDIITSHNNTGTVANCNRGLQAALGRWIKFCAGDDVLMPNCIKDNMAFVHRNTTIKALFSYCRMYNEQVDEDHFVGRNPGKYPSHIITKAITAEEQYKLLLSSNRIPFTPSFFIEYETRVKNGLLDEKFPFADDYQLFLSLTRNGTKLYFMEEETVKYRLHQNSKSQQMLDSVVNPMYFANEPCMKKLSYPYLPWDVRYFKSTSWTLNQIFRISFFNRKNIFNTFLHYFLNKIMNPFSWIIFIKTKLFSKYKNNPFYK